METGLWLLGFGLPLCLGAGFLSPKSPHPETTFHMLLFWIGSAMSFFGWTMALLAATRGWGLHPAAAVFLWLSGFGVSGIAIDILHRARKKKLAE